MRKRRLLACACARRLWSHFVHDRFRDAVDVAEQYADGSATTEELSLAYRRASLLAEEQYDRASNAFELDYGGQRDSFYEAANQGADASAVANVAVLCAAPDNSIADASLILGAAAEALAVVAVPVCLHSPADPIFQRRRSIRAQEEASLVAFFDCIFGPSSPVDFSAWRTGTAVALARQMYESRDFGAMPILADALQEAGCDNADVLNHCRDATAAHFRGCWVVDGVLGLE
jgi:hypothetical protein